MTRHELDAAGIGDPQLREDYLHCRALNAQHGRTYFLATRLLPPARRPAVHALYGFARWADDIVDGVVDDQDPATGHATRHTALQKLSDALDQGLTAGWAHEPVVRALADTARRHAIDPAHFTDFMTSMQSDLHVRDYADFPALRRYMHGSAAVIGLQMLPVLGHVTAREEAEPHAAALGVAFQMTNFLRDVGEDLDRGRVYLPGDLLAAHGTDRAILQWSRATGRRDRRITAALRDFAGMTRGFYRNALPGIAILDPVSRPCIRTACVLYGGILTAVERDGWAVLHRRSSVPRRVRATVALDGLVRVGTARVRAARVRQRPATTVSRAAT